MATDTLYERLGGRSGVRAVVDDFYDRLVADERLGPLFDEADLEYLRTTQTDFLCQAAGGPETYDGPPVKAAHLDVPLTPALVARAIDHLERSLDAYDVDGDDRDAVVEAVARYERDLLADGTDEDDSDEDDSDGNG